MIELKHRHSGALLYKSEKITVREAVIEAVEKGASLVGANLKGASLVGASLEGASLEGAYLKDASLEGAYLKDANLEGANLKGAYLKDANLEGANLKGAYLKGASLAGANLKGASLVGANLVGASLVGARWVIDAGQSFRSYQFIGYWRDGLRVKAGCRDFPIEVAKIHWEDTPEEYAKVALIESVAKARGWNSEAAESEVSQPAVV